MKVIYRHIVSDEIIEKVRASDYLLKHIPYIETKSGIKKALKKQRFLINRQICNTGTLIKTGQIIEFLEEHTLQKKVFKLRLNVIFEDDFIALINKPAGISVSGNYFKTIQNALPYNLKKSEQTDTLQTPLPVHRLDNQTSGLLLIAKTHKARINLGKQFEEKKIKKKYNAVVIGKPSKSDAVNFPVDGKNAFTRYETLKTEKSLRNGYLSLLNLYPETGRTHQLRIHCEKAGFPILGDKLYNGNSPVFKGKGLFLSASEINFIHPLTNEFLTFEIPYPKKFDKIIEREKQRHFTANL
ncbi:MAG: RluA family pseudouridine synthase [Bacteroidales bacterium]|nr:RluA family pseudouridine synthase [Bacteroidales bacterium]